ncbi:MAG: Tetratricopeptide TPR_1 repeat-containing protein [candidate division TM6 bacterium GW2011_GWF2_28_16]|nr:MAG: Tetratricopeptide TPR_1 repeat-containing protein [candidate division TM6 bacterium GW2011_GWF2_28_16]
MLNKKILYYLPPVLISLFTVILYWPTLKYPFIYDDMPTITENFHVIKGNYLNNIFFAFNRWISRFLHSYIYKLWGENPTPFRVFNLAMHITIGLLIFFTLKKLFNNLNKNSFLKTHAYLISFFTSTLFLLHPTQTQTVTYITQMSLEGLTNLFIFLVITSFVYASFTQNKFIKYFLYFISIIFTVFAAGTKEIIIILPFLVLLIDICFISQGNFKSLKKRLLIHALIFLSLFITLNSFGFKPVKFTIELTQAPLNNNRGNILTSNIDEKITSYNYFITQFKILTHYLRIYFWPKPLAFDYGHKLTLSIFNLDFILPFIFILFLILLSVYLFIKDKTNFISFGLAWFFIGILPRASFIPSTELICDYKTYISSFGAIFLISVIIIYLFTKIIVYLKKYIFIPERNTLFSLLLIFILISSYTTNSQYKIWQSELVYWQHAVNTAPNKANLWNNLGVALSGLNRIDDSINAYKKACELDKTYAEPIINLAFHYQARGDYDLAMNEYSKAINLSEFHPEMYLNLGSLHLTKKAYKPAEICFDLALKYRPYYSRAHFNKGLMYEQQNMFDKALECYENAINGNMQTTQFYYQHAITAQKLGKLDLAINSLEEAKQIDPFYLNTTFILASIYYQKHDYKNAAINFELTYKKEPNNTVNIYNLAQSLLNLREYNKALELFKLCEHDTQTFPYTKLHIAKCLNEVNQKQDSINLLNNLIKNPPHLGVKNDAISLLKEITI